MMSRYPQNSEIDMLKTCITTESIVSSASMPHTQPVCIGSLRGLGPNNRA